MSARRRTSAGSGSGADERAAGQFAPVEDDMDAFLRQEEEMRKQFDPVAPWNRKNIPDYGPVSDKANVLIFGVIGVIATIFYETTDYFDQVNRYLAYAAIWFPLWFRLLGRVSPAPTEDELDEREKHDFFKQLQKIQQEEEDEIDE